MTPAEAVTDVTQAKAMGFDAFALNIISTEQWSTASIGFLFQAAAAIGFHLFFSFDMLHFTSPSQFFPLLQQYASSPAYYKYNNLPFVSMCGSDLLDIYFQLFSPFRFPAETIFLCLTLRPKFILITIKAPFMAEHLHLELHLPKSAGMKITSRRLARAESKPTLSLASPITQALRQASTTHSLSSTDYSAGILHGRMLEKGKLTSAVLLMKNSKLLLRRRKRHT